MEWLNLHTSVLDSAEVQNSAPVDRSTWLFLLRYCIGQENGGRLLAVAAWNDRNWLRNVGVSLKEVKRDCPLWKWEGDDVSVLFYPLHAEADVHRLRGQASAAGHASWHKRRMKQAIPVGEPLGLPAGEPPGMPEGNAKRNGKEGKERKGNETPPTPNGRESHLVNGSEPASRNRPPKPGAIIPAEQPDPLRGRLIVVAALKGRQPTEPWSLDELEAFRAARLHDCSDADLAAQVDTLRPYYHANIPRGIDRRRQDLKALLTNWPGELDRARAHRRDHNDGIQKV
jgi:hypothetical protein